MSELPPLSPLPPIGALPPARDQRKVDADNLDLLAIFHFVAAGLSLIGIAFLAVHYTFMHAFLFNPKMWEHSKQAPPPPELFAVLKWFYAVLAIWFVASGILNLISGFKLRARQGRTFSLVVSAINCLHLPLGTILGVFTIVVLSRPTVAEVYAAGKGRG